MFSFQFAKETMKLSILSVDYWKKVTIRAITVLVNEYDSLWKFDALCDEFTS